METKNEEEYSDYNSYLGKELTFKKNDNSIDHITITKFLAKGGNGAVFSGRSTQGDNYVIKIGTMYENEINFIKKINEYYGIGEIDMGERGICQFHVIKQRGLFNIRDLSIDIIQGKRDKLPVDELFRIINGCINEILFSHEQGVCLYDIQPKNFTLDNELNVYLVDFGDVDDASPYQIRKDFETLKNVSRFLVTTSADMGDEEKLKLMAVLEDMIDSRGKKITIEQNNQIKKSYFNYKESIKVPDFVLQGFGLFTSQESKSTMENMDNAKNDFHRYLIAKKFIENNPNKQFAQEIIKVISDSEVQTNELVIVSVANCKK